ncbi:gastrula zinc finger protein XlCGF7.1-like isoform X1 [Cimex lectularius]|uniref:C2H2-type domain-containing protein n=1 Tax=Cimex lectularius TaxID=79782 RepID=A0A8I6RCT6_CIMLE|nr:gastrula zinc finger protein XlCGF7.1-like isoform X1 [Cimex lectularius]
MENKEEFEVLDALYPETQIFENADIWKKQKCHKCGETFTSRQSRQQHMKERHSGSFVCEICGKSFSQRSGLTHHLPMHSEVKAFQCNICGKSFRQRSGLTHHKQTHSEVKAFVCDICGKHFAQGSGLIHHKSTHSLVKNFACNYCGKKFAQRSGLAHHKNIHTKSVANILSTNSTISGNTLLTESPNVYKMKVEEPIVPIVISLPMEGQVLSLSSSSNTK